MNDPHDFNVVVWLDLVVNKVRSDDLPSIFSRSAVVELPYLRVS